MIYINLLMIVSCFAILFYRKDGGELKKKFKIGGLRTGLYPFANLIYLHQGSERMRKNHEAIKKLHPLVNEKLYAHHYFLENIYRGIIVFFLMNVMSVGLLIWRQDPGELIDSRYIVRKGVGEGQKQLELIAECPELGLQKVLIIAVGEQQITSDEYDDLFSECHAIIDQAVLGDNLSFSQIQSPLNLITEIAELSVKIDWKIMDYELISTDGRIKNEQLLEEVQTQIMAVIHYFDQTEDYLIELTIIPKVLSDSQLWEMHLNQELWERDQANVTDEYLELPLSLDGHEITWHEKTTSSNQWLGLLGVVFGLVVIIYGDEQISSKVKERNKALRRDYPEMVHRFVLLLGTGMTAKAAWEKMVYLYEKGQMNKRNTSYVYEELAATIREMKNGTAEIRAYENFGKRCALPEYQKFGAMVIQHIKMGSKGMNRMLIDTAGEAVLMRQETAKRLGEETGTKLLFPMMIMLLVVFIVVIVPAFMSMNF